MLYSAQHNMVVYDLPAIKLAQVGNVIPAARLLNGSHVAVPCTVSNMQAMLRLGHEVTSPILTAYDWPHSPLKFSQPFAHQKIMSAFLTLNPRAFNLSDMGTGKTLSVLWALDYLMHQGLVKKALILSPLSTIYRVWEDEIFTHFLSRRSSCILYGNRSKRLEQLNKDADFYIINHDGLGVGSSKGTRGIVLGTLAQQIKDAGDIDAVVVDEGSVYKDSGTLRYRVLRAALSHKKWLWWLTGTPVPVEPTNAWSQARIVRPEYQESFMSLRDRTMTRVSQFKWVPKQGSADIAASILQPSIRFAREDCLDLPECMVETRDVELSTNQKAAYDELKKTLRTQIGAGQITAINEATLRMKLIQIACGAVYGPDHDVNRIDAAPRLAGLHEIIEQCTHKILIFAPLTSVINLLFHELKDKYKVERIIGDVSAKRRAEVFRDFQGSDSPRIIVADPRTMAHGLTLTAANTVVWYGPTDQPEIYSQANARINRPGQRNQMLVIRLAATVIEREIYRRLDSRESMQGLILNLVKGE